MKKYISIAVTILMFLSISCGTISNMEETYTPPVLKSKPKLYYPVTAQEKSFSGAPKVLIFISKTGLVDKTQVLKSSGYDVLDNSALDYCKGLLFDPAVRNGKLVSSRMEMEVKFIFSASNWSINNYIRRINELYKIMYSVGPTERNLMETEILNMHNEFVRSTKDALNFNFYVEQVISPEIAKEWKRDWNAWPLSFLLYHDFIIRYPNYDSLANAKSLLIGALKEDLQYMNSVQVGSKEQEQKEILIIKIKNFINNKYPGILSTISGQNSTDLKF